MDSLISSMIMRSYVHYVTYSVFEEIDDFGTKLIRELTENKVSGCLQVQGHLEHMLIFMLPMISDLLYDKTCLSRQTPPTDFLRFPAKRPGGEVKGGFGSLNGNMLHFRT